MCALSAWGFMLGGMGRAVGSGVVGAAREACGRV